MSWQHGWNMVNPRIAESLEGLKRNDPPGLRARFVPGKAERRLPSVTPPLREKLHLRFRLF